METVSITIKQAATVLGKRGLKIRWREMDFKERREYARQLALKRWAKRTDERPREASE